MGSDVAVSSGVLFDALREASVADKDKSHESKLNHSYTNTKHAPAFHTLVAPQLCPQGSSLATVPYAPAMGEDGGLLLVRLPDADTSGQCRLSPYDLSCKGRSTPMLWFYDTVLDVEKLTAALEAVLAKGYAVLCGRYAAPETEGGTPLAVDLNNKGVVLYLGTATVDTPHLPPYTEQPLSSAIQTQGYNTSAQTQWLPPKVPGMPKNWCGHDGSNSFEISLQQGLIVYLK